MKNSIRKTAGLLLMAFAFMFMPNETMASLENNDISVITKDDLVGGWEYTVEGAPEGYDKGFMIIVNQGGVYKVQVQMVSGPVNGENVMVKGNKITFTITVEGETVSVALEAKGSQLSGTSTSPSDGTMKITGIKSISPQ